MLRRLIDRTKNSAVAWSMTAAGLRVGGMVLILPLILHLIPTEELGLWYVFLSIGGLTSLLDFGFDPTVTRAVGYAWAGAKELKPIGIHAHDANAPVPTGPNYELLNRLIVTMRDYYRSIALVALALMLTAGSWWIWKKTVPFEHAASLRWAWIFFCLGGAFNGFNVIWSPLLAGINGVRQSQQLLLASLITYYAAVSTGVLLHWGIWAMVVAQFLMGAVSRYGGRYYFFKLAGAEIHLAETKRDWHLLQILWPMAWRSGLLSIGSYLILNANTLICSAYLGLAETASYGLTLQLISFLVVVSQVWVQVKFPLINQLRVHQDYVEIARIFSQRIKFMLITYSLGALTICVLAQPILATIHAKTTILPQPILGVFLFIYLLEMHHSQYVGLVYSENENPYTFIWLSLGSGIAIISLSMLLTPRLGVWGMILSVGSVQLCGCNWWPVVRAIRGLRMSLGNYFSHFIKPISFL